LLEREGVSHCLHDMTRSRTGRMVIGPLVYVRFHGPAKYSGRYDERVLNDWAEWLAAQMRQGRHPPSACDRAVAVELRLVPGARGRELMATTTRDSSPRIRKLSSRTRHTSRRNPTASESSNILGVRISHPDRLIYPDRRISKIQLAQYYERIARWIVPHVAARPLTLVHCPAGVAAPCNFLKHAKAWGPSALRRVRIQEKTKVGEYLVADSIEAVVSLAQMGIVEIHTWNCTADDIEHPNRLVWDLDPGPEVAWKQVVKAAELVRDVLETLGLKSWVKTTGGRGLHVVAPIKRKRPVSECLEFSRAVSEAVTRTDPRSYTTAFAKIGRERQILIDYLRNNRTNTSICAFSPRARPGATVSMPLDWKDLHEPPDRSTLLTVPRRLDRLRADPWKDYWQSAQIVSAASFAAVTRVSPR
jgi:bifunctional non-homologous end joining protein LigD